MPSKHGIRHFFRPATVWKVSLFNGAAVVVRVIFAYLTNKIIVVYLGPAGTALTEQMKNFVQAVQGISTVGMNEAVIRYAAFYQHRLKRLIRFLAATYRLILAVAVVLMVLVMAAAPAINELLFPGKDYLVLIYITALLIPLYALQLILLAVLQGFQRYKTVARLTGAAAFAGMVLTWILVRHTGMQGALTAVAFVPVVTLVLILAGAGADIRKLLWIPLGNGAESRKRSAYFRRLIPFIWMAGVTAVVIPLATIGLRNLIIRHYGDSGIVHAGYWDAVRKVSAFYFMFITPVFNMYYFPRLSRRNGRSWKAELKEMLFKFYPLVAAGLLGVWIFRETLTLFIFSPEYEPVNALYGWQIAGDAVRLISLLLAYRMWVKAMVNKYLFAELSYWGLYYLLSAHWVPLRGLEGVMAAYVAANAYYLGVMGVYFLPELKNSNFINSSN
ncbi:MAG: oligosaccharide flippase family protein [Chlorobi bacterium]|nr:oligosaccharide flippase family protein [Chlorobiota bacterium]